MKRINRYTLIFCLLLCLPSLTTAKPITHYFSTLLADKKIDTSDPARKTFPISDGITYTLEGKIDLYWDCKHRDEANGTIAFNFLENGDKVTISPAFKRLNHIIFYLIASSTSQIVSNITVEFSADGVDWTSVKPTITYGNGSITVNAPSDDEYYVRIRRTSGSTNVSIYSVTYYFNDCSCFTYTPE